jgi:hypothetical protein
MNELNNVNDDIKSNKNTESYKSKYGKVYQVSLTIQPDDFTNEELSYIFKKPNTASYDRYIKGTSQSPTKALKIFVQDNIIDEQAGKLEKDLEEYPALALSLGEKLLNMLGLSKDINLKQL